MVRQTKTKQITAITKHGNLASSDKQVISRPPSVFWVVETFRFSLPVLSTSQRNGKKGHQMSEMGEEIMKVREERKRCDIVVQRREGIIHLRKYNMAS